MQNEQETLWSVAFTGKARKQKGKLPKAIASTLDLLTEELEQEGPERLNWHH
ncbi:MAG: hypothetical protein LBU79_06700 [Planctomycetota bacterium]|nr:hypothetical protein [Planctomycetota bacterium]